jgi:Lon-like ATP-dependent protease
MEVLEVSGYVSAEKMNIAERYLSPQAKESSGLKDVDITLEPEAIESLIRYYCRESGVRNLKKHIEKVSTDGIQFNTDNRSTVKLPSRSSPT